MILEQILNDKGGRVITVDDKVSLSGVAKTLDEHRIGAIVAISGEGQISGVLSERDIVRQVARHGDSALTMTVSDAMTREVVTATRTMALDDALQLMTDRRIRHLPILEGDELIGVVSIGDLVKWKIAGVEAEAEAMKSYLSAQF